MKKLLKKNQILITAFALMLAVAGYLHFSGKGGTSDSAVGVSADGSGTEVSAGEEEEMLTYEISDADIEQELAAGEINSLDEDAVITSDYLAEDINIDEGAAEGVADGTSEGVIEDVAEDMELGVDEPAVSENPGEAVFTSAGTIHTFSGAKLLKEQTRAKNKELLLEIIDNINITQEQKEEAIAGMIELTEISEKEMSAEILLEAKGFGDAVVSMSENSVDVFVFAYELTESQRAQIEDIVKRKTGVSAENIIITAVDE